MTPGLAHDRHRTYRNDLAEPRRGDASGRRVRSSGRADGLPRAMQVASPAVERPVALRVPALEPAMTPSVADDSEAGEVHALDLHHADPLPVEETRCELDLPFRQLDW